MIIAFDVDDTLTKYDKDSGRDHPNYENIAIFNYFKKRGNRIIVWSGGGEDYARTWCHKLGLHPTIICAKTKDNALLHKPDLTFDDEIVKLGKVNYRV